MPPRAGFVNDVRRLNVAITRAKRALWVLGSRATLRANPEWAALIGCAPCGAAAKCLTGALAGAGSAAWKTRGFFSAAAAPPRALCAPCMPPMQRREPACLRLLPLAAAMRSSAAL